VRLIPWLELCYMLDGWQPLLGFRVLPTTNTFVSKFTTWIEVWGSGPCLCHRHLWGNVPPCCYATILC